MHPRVVEHLSLLGREAIHHVEPERQPLLLGHVRDHLAREQANELVGLGRQEVEVRRVARFVRERARRDGSVRERTLRQPQGVVAVDEPQDLPDGTRRGAERGDALASILDG